MKMSLREITYPRLASTSEPTGRRTYILMLQMLQQLQFSVCSLGEYRCAEGLHDLLDRNILSRELILGRTGS